MEPAAFFKALPAYLGGKRRFAPLIFALISENLPRSEWSQSVFLDPFCGGGSCALYAKAQGFQVVASDLAERAMIVARALVANPSVRLTQLDILQLFEEATEAYDRIATTHSPSVFTARQAEWLDRALARANRTLEPKRSLLLLLIVKLALRCQPMSMLRGTDARAAAEGNFDRVSPRRLGHYLKARELLKPDSVWGVAEEINAGVFSGRGRAIKGDAISVLDSEPADVVYLDPPYAGTASYEREYKVLDEMLGDEVRMGPLPRLEDLMLAARHVPLLVLSYGGPTVSLPDLQNLVGRHRRVVRAVSIPYTHLQSISRRPAHERYEYIIVARN